jgi:hypothetical protein
MCKWKESALSNRSSETNCCGDNASPHVHPYTLASIGSLFKMMVIPAVHGFKTLPVTALPSLIEKFSPVVDGGSPETDEDDKIHFSIPLAPVDRAVLDRLDQRWNLLDSLQKDDSYPSLLLHLFHNWDWSFTIQSRMLSLFTNQSALEETQTRTRQYKAALHLAGWSKGFGRDEFRSLQLLKENEGFLARLGDRSFFFY